MNKRRRQYIGILSAIISYYIVHEGAHLIYSLMIGTFKQINFLGLGIQVDIYRENMTDIETGIFCIIGTIGTFLTSIILILLTNKIIKLKSKILKCCMYYITISMFFIDPIYLSFIYKFVGGGDMNGIILIIPEYIVVLIFVILLIFNIIIFIKYIFPKYKLAFK